MKSKVRLFALIGLTCLLLAMVFIFQRFDYFAHLQSLFSLDSLENSGWPYTPFVVNKLIRFLINDAICIFFIYVLFKEKKYLSVAFYLFLIELFVILPLYFWIKLSTEGDSELSSPLLSQIHRLIINPTLMILLMVSFLYQKKRTDSRAK
ncbi:MAG TPA: exosortase F system-associated protein [Chryseolinea sp.]|nr:exosortase F system-associated protein [Chryseolinea sp.]HPM31547.1 exosortase F system-associated protein [Chryseolinea sp.]